MKRTFIPIIIGALLVIAGTGLTVGAANIENEIVSEPIAGTGTISGTITNSSGAPQENAHVVAFAFGIIGGPAFAVASTASNGGYEVIVPEGRYHVIAFKFGEGVAFASPVKVDSGSNTDLDLSLTGGIIPGAGPSSVSSEPVNVESTSLEVKSNDPVITPTKANGVITGTITNQNSNPIAFVRVIAVGDPGDPNTQLGFTITHLLFGGIGYYSMNVPAGRYLFIRAAKLPLYLGAWAGPVSVEEGQTVTLDLSITYIGPDNLNTVVLANQVTGLQIQGTQSEPTNI